MVQKNICPVYKSAHNAMVVISAKTLEAKCRLMNAKKVNEWYLQIFEIIKILQAIWLAINHEISAPRVLLHFGS